MKVLTFAAVFAAIVSAGFASAPPALADTAQEAIQCQLKEGKTMADLDKAIEAFNKMIGEIEGGEQYKAWLMTPVAADNLAQIFWIGEMPDHASLAVLQDDYLTSEAGRDQDKKFQKVLSCESRSLWSTRKIK